jgi:hypothetical protein
MSLISYIFRNTYKYFLMILSFSASYPVFSQAGASDFTGVNLSDDYEVSISNAGATRQLHVFINSCPEYQPGYQNMETKDKNPLSLFSGRSISWSKFSHSYPVTVNVKIINPDLVPGGKPVKVLPSRFEIETSTNGNTVSFTLSEPGQYSLEIGEDGYKNGLMIFADPPETDIPTINDPSFLVLNEASHENISLIPGSYSGIYFSRGVHDIGIWDVPVHIKNIYFEDGSWVYGALRMDGNPGVRIYGRGVLSSYRLNYRQAHCIEAINGSNEINIEGLVVADPKYFGIRLIGRDNIISYAKVIGGWVYNCDGISAFAGSRVSKCFIWANDDAVKAYRDSLQWSDIVVWQLNNGGIIQMSWGGATGGSTSKGVTIKRLDVLHAEWNVDRFNAGLLNCVGNHYHDPGKSDLIENWLIENVVCETAIPLIWNITPDSYSACHIKGLKMKNWNVKMYMDQGFINRIKGGDPAVFFTGFVFDSVIFNNVLLTNTSEWIKITGMQAGFLDTPQFVPATSPADTEAPVLYPNPVNRILFLGEEKQYSIYNLSGMLVSNGTDNKVNVSGLKSGLYIIRSGNKREKFIKY